MEGKVLRIDRADRRDYNLGGFTCHLGFVFAIHD